MNAKKIMGAVLVALLAAALFVGAGAAEDSLDGKTVFVNQKVNGLTGTWTSGTNSITAIAVPGEDGYGYFTGEIVEGAYTKGTGSDAETITVKYPTVSVVGIANKGDVDAEYQFINGIFYKGSIPADVTVTSPAGIEGFTIYLTIPNKGELMMDDETKIEDELLNPALGEYSIRVVYPASAFVNGTLYDDRISKPVSFKVAEADATTISASVNQALPSDSFKVTITGQPGKEFTVSYKNNVFSVEGNQLGLPGVTADDITAEGFDFVMPNTGKVEFTAKLGAAADKTAKMSVQMEDSEKKPSVSINVVKGTLTAKTDAASYFVGDIVKISGTSTAGAINMTLLQLTGTNFIAKELTDAIVENSYEEVGTAWSFELDTSEIKNEKDGLKDKMIDVGTYTLTLETDSAKATVAIVLKQPFISIIEAPEVVVQDTDVEFIVNAEATDGIAYYIFGTNYFVNSTSEDKVEETENQFIIELTADETKVMDAGQYFMVIQHKMYDGYFNIIAAEENNIILVDESGEPIGQPLFNVFDRQTANAAQALCDALDTQNVDDMYVKYSFFVVGKDAAFTISDIPETIAKGDTLTISGTSTAAAGEYVTVEMISTAFAAVPKETVGSAAFIAVTTQVAEDGTWEVTFDTSDLNVDEYSLKVACDGTTWKNVNIDVVEAADKPDTPVTPPADDEPEQPTEPEAPATPGFGALAALAGLGAVAVLLLRRE